MYTKTLNLRISKITGATIVILLLVLVIRGPIVVGQTGSPVYLDDPPDNIGWRDLAYIVVYDNTTHLIIDWKYLEPWPVGNGSYDVSREISFGLDLDNNRKTGYYGAEVVIDTPTYLWHIKDYQTTDSTITTTYNISYSYDVHVEYYASNGSLILYTEHNEWMKELNDTDIVLAIPLDQLNISLGDTVVLVGSGLVPNSRSEDTLAVDYYVNYTLPYANIVVDGNIDDWSGITPLATDCDDNVNDTYYQYGNLTAVYIAANDSMIFLRIDLNDSSLKLSEENIVWQFYLELDTNNDGVPDYYIYMSKDEVGVGNITVISENNITYYYYDKPISYKYSDYIVSYNSTYVEIAFNASIIGLSNPANTNITITMLGPWELAILDEPGIWSAPDTSSRIFYTIGLGGYVAQLISIVDASYFSWSQYDSITSLSGTADGLELNITLNTSMEPVSVFINIYGDEPTGNASLGDLIIISNFYVFNIGNEIVAPIEVAYNYSELDITDVNESSLCFYFYNASAGIYQPVSECIVDTVNKIVYGSFTLEEYLAGDDPVLVVAGQPVVKEAAPTKVLSVWVDDNWSSYSYGDIIYADGNKLVYGVNATSSISEALTLVSGGVVYVYPGVYNEVGIPINISVNISGIIMNNTRPSIIGDIYPIFLIENPAPNSTIVIENLDIYANSSLGGIRISSIQGSYIIIKNNRILSATDTTGISIYMEGENTSGTIDITNNVIGSSDAGVTSIGIEIYCVNTTYLGNITISNNTLNTYNIDITVFTNNSSLHSLFITNNDLNSFLGIYMTNSSVDSITINENNITGISIVAVNATSANITLNYNNVNLTGSLGLDTEGITVNASLNWWGDLTGPLVVYANGTTVHPGTGAYIYVQSGDIIYSPWLNAPYPEGKPISGKGTARFVALDPSIVNIIQMQGTTDVEVDINVSTSVNASISSIKYDANPTGVPLPYKEVKYVDVYVATENITLINEILVKIYYTSTEVLDEASLIPYWWNGTAWVECSDWGINTTDIGDYSGYVWIRIDANTIPSIYDLTGTVVALATTTATPIPEPPYIPVIVLVTILAALIIAAKKQRINISSR